MAMRSHCYAGPVPRKVDTEQQKTDIAHAVWRLAERSGLESVSLREVAAEAHVSMGRVQYYFRTREEMLLHGLRLAQQRMRARVEQRLGRLPEPAGGEDTLRAVLEEMTGEDPDTRQAIRVSVAYHPRAAHDPEVARLLFGDDAELRSFAAETVRAAQAEGRACSDLDPEHESRVIWSLAESLGVEVAFGRLPFHDARSTLRYHLARVFGDGAESR